jgi:hypothetical protein
MPNQSLIHADVFFFISTIALVIISAGLGVAIFYLIKILRNVREFSDKAKEEGFEMLSDLKKLRAGLRDEGIKWKHVATLVRSFFGRKAEKIDKVRSIIHKKAGDN